MSRRHLDYSVAGSRHLPTAIKGAVDVSRPTEGFYRFRLRSDGVRGAVRIWFGPPHDPVTGEELDRSWRWQATFNNEPIDFDRVWPACVGDPLTFEEYNFLIARNDWAKRHAPESAFADPRKRNDRLTAPLEF